MPDQMPFGVTQVAQSICLPSKLLHPVLAENAQAGGVCLADAFHRKRFAHAHQRDFSWIAGCPARCCCDPFLYSGDIFRNRHKAKTTKDTKYHEGESVLASVLSAGPSCARLGQPRAAVPTLARSLATLGMTAHGFRFAHAVQAPSHHADWRSWFVGVARARKWNPDHDDGQTGHHDESHEIRWMLEYLRDFPIADLGDSND